MGFNRFIKKNLIPFYNTRDMIDKIRTYGIVDGVKEKIREDYLEDTPGLSHIYNAGRYAGKREGYVEASRLYENKLLDQAEVFLSQQKVFENQKEQYEELLNEYEQYINEMSVKDSLTNEEETYLNQIMFIERNLAELKS